jgi:hypothetical protein
LHSTHLRTAAVGGLVGIGGLEKALGFWALGHMSVQQLLMPEMGSEIQL